MHRWIPKIMFGAGEPHRGFYQTYTRRVTAPLRDGSWGGGTTQIVRYEVGGMGVMVRYGVDAMLPAKLAGKGSVEAEVGEDGSDTPTLVDSEVSGQLGKESIISKRHVYDTKDGSHSTKTSAKSSDTVDRDRFLAIRTFSPNDKTNTPIFKSELYFNLVTSQTSNYLIAPHHKGDFNYYQPEIIDTSHYSFDATRVTMDASIRRGVAVWKNMVNITRSLGRNVSFVGNDDGSLSVLEIKKYQGARLSEMAKEMIRGAERESLFEVVGGGKG
jgi:hypothetical protein